MQKNYFKNILLVGIALFICLPSFGQFSKEKWRPYTLKQKNSFFKKAIKDGDFEEDMFDVTSTPTKWENESVIILAKKLWYKGYVNNWNNVAYYTYKARVRFKLQDLSAVESFSTYYFDEDEIIEITIEKPDGTRNIIDQDEAIEVKEEATVPYFGKISVSKSKKIAFENLQPGDILDVKVMNTTKRQKNHFHKADYFTFWFYTTFWKMYFATIVNTNEPFSISDNIVLNDDLPVLEQKIEFDLGKHFYLNFRSLNGAPELEELPKLSNKRNRWLFHDKMRDKRKNEIWSSPLGSLPSIKYEIHFMSKRTRRGTDKLINKKTGLTTSAQDLNLKKVARDFIRDSKKNTGNIYYNYYKKEGKKISSNNRAFIEGFYNYYRTNKLYEVARLSDYPAYDASVENEAFTSLLIKILKKRGIPYKVIMGVPNSTGGYDGLISRNDIIWGIKASYGNEDVLYTDCDFYAEPGDVNPIFEGIKLYEVKPSWLTKNIELEETEIPISSPSKNKSTYTIVAEFQDDLDTLKVTRKTHLTGMARYRHKYQTFPYDKYYEKVKDRFNATYNFIYPNLYEDDLSDDEDFLEEEDERLTQSTLNRRNYFVKKNAKNDIKSDYELVDYESLKVEQDGLSLEEPDIIYEENFRLKDLLDPLGNGNYILKVGEFIDGQIELKDIEERERQSDIEYPYARSFAYEIEIKIPAQMKVSGIEALNKEVTTEAGSFKSSAKIKGSSLFISVEKRYQGIYHSKEKWVDILKFVDEAVDFRSIKVILKK